MSQFRAHSHRHRWFLCFLWIAAATSGKAAPDDRSENVFTNGLVLQQGVDVPIWGTAKEGFDTVTVEFQGQVASSQVVRGRWTLRLKPLTAGGPWPLTIQYSRTSRRRLPDDGRFPLTGMEIGSSSGGMKKLEAYVGEVWLCCEGQGTTIPLGKCVESEAALAEICSPRIHLFKLEPSTAEQAPRKPRGSWTVAEPRSIGDCSAVNYEFGRELLKFTEAPVGIIQVTTGDLLSQARAPREAPANPSELNSPLGPGNTGRPDARGDANRPVTLCDEALELLASYAVRGVVWHPSEAGPLRPPEYSVLLRSIISNWRSAWGSDDLPFIMTQFGRFAGRGGLESENGWAELREAQLTSLSLAKTGVVVTVDLDPKDNALACAREVARRLALVARSVAYGQKTVHSGPRYVSMKAENERIRISFKDVGDGLVVNGDVQPKGFEIAGDDDRFFSASAAIQGSEVVVWHGQVTDPVAVRFGWANSPVINLYNRQLLPVVPFQARLTKSK